MVLLLYLQNYISRCAQNGSVEGKLRTITVSLRNGEKEKRKREKFLLRLPGFAVALLSPRAINHPPLLACQSIRYNSTLQAARSEGSFVNSIPQLDRRQRCIDPAENGETAGEHEEIDLNVDFDEIPSSGRFVPSANPRPDGRIFPPRERCVSGTLGRQD